MLSCTFCDLYQNNKSEIIYESNFFFSRFDKFPVSPGHCEVIPKRHVKSLFDLTSAEWNELQGSVSDTVECLVKTDLKGTYDKFISKPISDKSVEFCKKMLLQFGIDKKPDGYNIGLNEGEAAGMTIAHLHLHIIPRFFGDVEDYVGGIRHIIPGLGNYKR